DGRQKPALLIVAAEGDQRGPQQLLADVAQPSRTAGADVFFVEDHLLREIKAGAAVLFGPGEAGEAGPPEVALPGAAQLEVGVLVSRSASPSQDREVAGKILYDPAADAGAEPLFLVGEPQVHGSK